MKHIHQTTFRSILSNKGVDKRIYIKGHWYKIVDAVRMLPLHTLNLEFPNITTTLQHRKD